MPTGSGRAAISSSPFAIASTRCGLSVRRSRNEALPPSRFMSATSLAFSARIAGEALRMAAAAAAKAAFLASVEASVIWRIAARAARPMACISPVMSGSAVSRAASFRVMGLF